MDIEAALGGSLDYFGTATLSFDLLPGESITSVGEFSQTEPIPEPATSVLLLASSLGMVAGRMWQRRCGRAG